MPQMQDTGQVGSQTITLPLAGAGLITLQYAFWVETPDPLDTVASIGFNTELPNNVPFVAGNDSFFLGDTTTDPAACDQVTFFHSGAGGPTIDITIGSAGSATYAYQIDWQTH